MIWRQLLRFVMVKKAEKIKLLSRRIRELEDALFNAALSGAKSASISSGGAAQSYTRYSIDELQRMLTMLKRELAQAITGKSNRRTAPNFNFYIQG